MINNKFEVYKLSRELKRHGKCFFIKRYIVNEFGEPSEELTDVGPLLGLFHKTVYERSTDMMSLSNGIQIRRKDMYAILCLYDEFAKLNLKVDDVLLLNGKKMRLIKADNIQEWNLIVDIFLEEIDDGSIQL